MRNFSAIVALALAACLAMATIGCSGGDYEKARSLYDSGRKRRLSLKSSEITRTVPTCI